MKAFISAPPAKTDPHFKAFLAERNPRQQHSSTLESYLIKPIQRVLKYPLLLKELYSLTDPDSEEHYHLDGKPVYYLFYFFHSLHQMTQNHMFLTNRTAINDDVIPLSCNEGHEQSCESHQ